MLRARGCANSGLVGDAWGERRRAKEEIGVYATAVTLRRSGEAPWARRTGRGGMGGDVSAFVLSIEERREEDVV